MLKEKEKIEDVIVVKNISKKFSIPHEKISTLKGAFVNIFHKKKSDSFYALKDISFEVKKGEFFGIIGRNGSGKSTLLKILAGVYNNDIGSIKINGRISPFLELGIGFNPELSGRDNIYLNATVLGLSQKQIDEKLNSIVAFSELERFIDQKIKNYSSGMQVRLAFSVAIHANREILLMDEVLAVGDVNFQAKCFQEFNKYRELGKTVILVTHDIGTIQRYCDRAMLIRNGEIVKIGNAEDVGTEYIYQNMSDEEQRLEEIEKQNKIEDKKNINEEERSRKLIRVKKILFFNKNNEEKKIFQTGDDIRIDIELDLVKIPEKFNYSVSIYDEMNTYIIGVNNIFDKVDPFIALQKKKISILFENIPLHSGLFKTKVLLVGENFSEIYDIYILSEAFKIVSKNKIEGLVNIGHKWL